MADLFRVKKYRVSFSPNPGPKLTYEHYFADRSEATAFVNAQNAGARPDEAGFEFWKGPTKYKVPTAVVDMVMNA
jgi:hypothetical protein